MSEENKTPAPNPKEAFNNLIKSVQRPLIWMAVGAVVTIYIQSRMRKTPS